MRCAYINLYPGGRNAAEPAHWARHQGTLGGFNVKEEDNDCLDITPLLLGACKQPGARVATVVELQCPEPASGCSMSSKC